MVVVKQDLPFLVGVKLAQDHGKGAFATAGKSHNGQMFPGLKVKGDVMEQFDMVGGGVVEMADVDMALYGEDTAVRG